MLATEAQIRDLANTIALQADAIATGKIPADELHAVARILHNNTETLRVWTDPDGDPRPEFIGKQLYRITREGN
jgi:hypothetical protein